MAGQLPTGTVAFVFTDIEGSTRLARTMPDHFPDLLGRHHEIMRSAFVAGHEVDAAGDAFFVVFERVEDAARAAATAQRDLRSEPWPEGGAVRVRIGLHAGAADVVRGSYVGLEVHRAARICAAAHGGQILVSEAAATLLSESPDGSEVVALGEYWLKDFDASPEQMHQLVGEGLGRTFPPPRTAEARIVSLPRERTSFAGRRDEVSELQPLIRANRLVTLTGEGGSGKTRLAVRVARNLAPHFRGPVVFVALARITSTDEAVPALAAALELNGAIRTWDEAATALVKQHGLIVWDNAEHLDGFAERLTELHDRCERLHALVTSRHPLAISDEQLYTVGPLDDLAALDLMVERVRRSQPQVDRDAVEPELREVAERLDRLPLALELAAARLRSLPIAALLDRLDHQLDLLSDPTTGRPERHRTMRAALSWSFELLAPTDRTLFASLAVFGAPARLEAIAQVAAVPEVDALDGLGRLIDASLVRLQDNPEPRYWMLEPVRQFAAEILADSGERRLHEERMLDWYAATAIEHRETPEVLVRAMRDERENLLRAFAYSAALGRWERGIELATEVVGGVFGLGGTSEAVVEWVREAEALGGGLSPYAQAQLALTPAPRETPQADQAQQALALARASGDRRLLCRALQDVAWVALEEERLAVADAAMAELSTLEPLPPLIQVNLLLNRAEMAETRGEVAAAEEAWAEAETAARATGDQTDLVRCFWYAAGAALAHGDSARAHALLTEALAADATWTSWPTVELALRYSTAVAAALEGKTREAAEHLQRALLVFDRVGSFDRLVELPAVILTASLVTARSGHRDASAALLAWAAARIDAPGHDTFALKAQREALGSPDLTPTDARDDAEILRLALDAVATVLAPAS